MSRIIFLSISVYLLLAGCNNGSNVGLKKNLLPGLEICDSAAIMYYHTPGNPRFFEMAKLYDKGMLTTITTDVNGTIISPKGSCATQGKIYYYGKGDVVYVIYFSREKNCMTLSFIKTAEKYFTVMSRDTKAILDELEKSAKKPGTAVQKHFN